MSGDEQNAFAANGLRDAVILDADRTSELKEEENDLDEDGWESEEFDEGYEEEDAAVESEELFETKYRVDNTASSDSAIAAIGDNAQITINNFIRVVRVSRQEASTGDGSDVTDDVINDKYKFIEEALRWEHRSGTFPVNPTPEIKAEDDQLLANEEGISKWYYNRLDVYEQCYVQAAAILHGAPANEISKRADDLYGLIGKQEEQTNVSPSQEKLQTLPQQEVLRPPITPPRNRSSRALQAKTYTITQRVGGIERLFWRDVDIYGLSTFGLRMLDFLAGEFMSKGTHGQDVQNKLLEWSQKLHSEEYSWRSARALGVFLWHQNVDELRRTAYSWAKNGSLSSWRRTAMLLDGAFEIDNLKGSENEGNVKNSPILRLLDEWIERYQQAKSMIDISMGCAAANAYGLIGKRKPEIALPNLERLLQIQYSSSLSERLSAAVVSAYVSLSWSGHIRDVLAYLASIAEQAILQPLRPAKMSERDLYRQQCEIRLNTALEVFFLVAADSLSAAGASSSTAYCAPLPDHPSLPDPSGRDIVLAGVLAQNAYGWREQVIRLLCAAIIDGSSRLIAFDLIHRWAETLLKMREGPSCEAKQLITLFKQCMVDLGRTVDAWGLDLKKRRRYSPPTDVIYKKRLEQWSKGKWTISSLARDVLCELNGKSYLAEY